VGILTHIEFFSTNKVSSLTEVSTKVSVCRVRSRLVRKHFPAFFIFKSQVEQSFKRLRLYLPVNALISSIEMSNIGRGNLAFYFKALLCEWQSLVNKQVLSALHEKSQSEGFL